MNVLISATKWFERNGLRMELSRHRSDFEIYEAANSNETLLLTEVIAFDIIVLEVLDDLQETLRLITILKSRLPGCKLLLFSENRSLAVYYLQNGADGFCCKTTSVEDFLSAIDTLLAAADSKYLHVDIILDFWAEGAKVNGRKVKYS